MTPKEYLDNIRYCDREIDEKQEYLDEMWARIKSIQSSHSDREMIMGGKKVSFDDRMARYIDYSREIDNSIDELVDMKMEVIRMIGQIPEEEYRTLLTARYVNSKGWKEVAEVMSYDERYIYDKHLEALAVFDKVRTKSHSI